jgi:hypothetical protein
MTKPTNLRWALAGLAVAGVAGCSGEISEPWVSGTQAEQLEAERSRSATAQKALRGRLERYADAYQ